MTREEFVALPHEQQSEYLSVSERGWYWADRCREQCEKSGRLMTLTMITLFVSNVGWLALFWRVMLRAQQ